MLASYPQLMYILFQLRTPQQFSRVQSSWLRIRPGRLHRSILRRPACSRDEFLRFLEELRVRPLKELQHRVYPAYAHNGPATSERCDPELERGSVHAYHPSFCSMLSRSMRCSMCILLVPPTTRNLVWRIWSHTPLSLHRWHQKTRPL
jgi:hypothetical protein